MSELEFVPNFIYQSTSGEISNSKSTIIQYNNLSFISYNKAVNIWNLKTSTLIKSIRHKKYLVTVFSINEDFLIIGFNNGLIQIYKLDEYEKYLEYRIHSKRIVSLIYEGKVITSASSDGLVYKYDLGLETSTKITQTNAIDVIDSNRNIIAIGTGDCTFTTVKDDKEHAYILNNRLKYLSILDDNNFLFIFRDNDIKIYNAENDIYKDCKKLKKIKSIRRINNTLYILGDKKLFSFIIKFEKGVYSLVELTTIDAKQSVIDFSIINSQVGFITKDNSYIKDKLELEYHKYDITEIKKDKNNRICSFSKDKLIIWNIYEDKLSFYNQIKISEGSDFCIYEDFYVLCDKQKIYFYNMHNLKIHKELNIEDSGSINVKMSTSEYSKEFTDSKQEILAIAINQKVNFYNKELEVIDSLDLQDFVSSIAIYNGNLFIGLLNPKVYIYDNNKDLLKTLYGHSLPVININVNDKLIYTIGADKMLKIWGLDFGDCRKSIIINESRNIQLVASNLFIVGSSILKYYHGFKIYHEKKYFDCQLLFLDEDYLIGSSENVLNIFSIDKYELEKIDEDSEDSEIMETNVIGITDLTKYEEFLNILEDSSPEIPTKFNRFVQEIGLGDLDSYLVLLSATQIYSLVDLLFYCENIIIASRIFQSLVKLHKEVIVGNKKCNELRIDLMLKMKVLRDKLGKNVYKQILRTGSDFLE